MKKELQLLEENLGNKCKQIKYFEGHSLAPNILNFFLKFKKNNERVAKNKIYGNVLCFLKFERKKTTVLLFA